MKPDQANHRPAKVSAPKADPAPATPADPTPPPRAAAVRPPDAHEHDLMTTAEASKRLTTFVDLARASGLTELLQGAGPLTVFAPSDRAFARMPQNELDALMADSDRLGEVMRHHVVQGKVRAPKPDLPRVATPLDGDELQLTSRTDAYRVDDARLVQTNIRASNGVIHVIDRVLLTT